jgi:hypothetical protein
VGEFADWSYDFDAEEFVFGVVDQGQEITVRVPRDALESTWGYCDDDEIVQQAIDHYDEITSVVPGHRLEDDGSVLIRPRDLRRGAQPFLGA